MTGDIGPGMRVIRRSGEVEESRYSMTSMARAILGIHDPQSDIIDYQIEGRDYTK